MDGNVFATIDVQQLHTGLIYELDLVGSVEVCGRVLSQKHSLLRHPNLQGSKDLMEYYFQTIFKGLLTVLSYGHELKSAAR